MTTMLITPEKMAGYRSTTQRRGAQRQAGLDARYQRAWQTVFLHQAAQDE